ncbi:hypothetical protein HBH75_086550 [Parastagonospora nodorum]|nr:hypothetical protein HBH75_086550 [Parastagonospora nodorum]
MEPTERWQPIAPASDEPRQQRSAPDSKRRRQAIAVACVQCRSGKVKCDGTRPRCMRCSEMDLACHFDVAEGVSRAERMRLLKRETLSGRAEEMERVIQALRTSSDDQASAILARLRIGNRLDEVVKTLPPVVSNPPSLSAQDLAGASISYATVDPSIASSDGSSSVYGRYSSAPHSPNITLSSWSGISSQAASAKGKQPASARNAQEPPFLSILFDRADCLGTISDEGEDEDDMYLAGFIDPQLLLQSNPLDAPGASTGSPTGNTRSLHQSPKDDFTPHSFLTHWSKRQPIVNAIRVHPNLNLRNLFGNMPFSSSVRANNYPLGIQNAQVNNLFLPTWAMMTVSTRPDPGSLKEAFQSLHRDTAVMIESGTPVEVIIETHPNIAALFDENEYNNSGVLSKWSAAMIHSAQHKGHDFTAWAAMYSTWYLARWMVSPSPETYEAMPEWLRPTPNQLFMPHINILDYVIWPAFREFAVQIPQMHEHMEYMMDMCINISCDWRFGHEEALCRNETTGMLDLCDMAKTTMRDLASWSLGPSFRQYVTNADTYVRIRAEEF